MRGFTIAGLVIEFNEVMRGDGVKNVLRQTRNEHLRLNFQRIVGVDDTLGTDMSIYFGKVPFQKSQRQVDPN